MVLVFLELDGKDRVDVTEVEDSAENVFLARLVSSRRHATL